MEYRVDISILWNGNTNIMELLDDRVKSPLVSCMQINRAMVNKPNT